VGFVERYVRSRHDINVHYEVVNWLEVSSLSIYLYRFWLPLSLRNVLLMLAVRAYREGERERWRSHWDRASLEEIEADILELERDSGEKKIEERN
jgi:hypothetical protein